MHASKNPSTTEAHNTIGLMFLIAGTNDALGSAVAAQRRAFLVIYPSSLARLRTSFIAARLARYAGMVVAGRYHSDRHARGSMSSSDMHQSAQAAPPEALAFRSLIRTAANDPRHAASVLADSYQQCRFPEIPAHVERLQTFLSSQDLRTSDCLVVELNNSVRGALTALALLDAGYSFVAMPVQGQGSRGGGNEVQLPHFCRRVVSVRTDKDAARASLDAPDDYLTVSDNPSWNPLLQFDRSDSPCLYFRTSGSLGSPKLATHGYARFCANVRNALAQFNLNPSHRIALPTPIFHLYGLGVGFLGGFAGGASIDLQERGNFLRYLDREREFKPNVAFVTPAFCETLIRSRKTPRLYELMITSGDRISDATFRRSEAVHGPMVNSYGCTEMGSVATGNLDMPPEVRCATVGRPYPGVSYRIVPLGKGEGEEISGELQLKYINGFVGYVDMDGNPLVPPNAFDDGWYRTGDLAMAGKEGTLLVLGRCDLSVNRNGVLLPFADVESRMRELAGVEEAAVTVGPENIRGRTLIAFCVLAKGIAVSDKELRAQYAARAPAFSVPDVVHIVEALPKLASGKIDRLALASLAETPSPGTMP